MLYYDKLTDNNTDVFTAEHIAELTLKHKKTKEVKFKETPSSLSLNEITLHFYHNIFQGVPSRIQLHDKYDINKLLRFLRKALNCVYFSLDYDFFALYADLDRKYIISVNCDPNSYKDNKCAVRFFLNIESDIESILSIYRPFVDNTRKKNKIGFFVKEYGEVVVKDFDLCDRNREHNDLMYNEDFKTSSSIIIDKLKQNESGLYLLYGEPGTGKSSFIKYLPNVVDRRFIYVPPHMVDAVFSADYLSMLVGELKGAILLIEDAEKVLLQRDASDGFHNSGTISSILNTTDGIYSDLTKLSIICTYNCDRNQIDKAFLRKGRLKYEYKFNPLTIERAKELAKSFHIDLLIDRPMTIAEILNPDDNSLIQEECTTKKFGF